MIQAMGLRSFLAALMSTLTVLASAAEAYPTHSMTFIVPYSAGGSSDKRARQIAKHMASNLGQAIEVVNQSGDGGNNGTALIAKASPDGYTFGMGNLAPMTVNRHLNPSLAFNPQKDLRAIGMIERGPLVLVVRAASDIRSLEDLQKKAKAAQGKFRYASAGVGGAYHLGAELLGQQLGFDSQHVAFDGGGKATEALLRGEVDFKFDAVPSVVNLLAEAQPGVRALAVASRRRSSALAGVPTLRELGHDNMEMSNWFGLVAPAATPDVVVSRLNAALQFALRQPDVTAAITGSGNELGDGPPVHFEAFMAAESYRWGRLIREKRITP